MTEDYSKSYYLVVGIICVIIFVGAFALDRYLKDNDMRDTYHDFTLKLKEKIRNMDCKELLVYGYQDLPFAGKDQMNYAKQIAKQKCGGENATDEEWGIKTYTPKEKPPSMDELYEEWKQ